jgi:hypothetical protein
MVSVYYYAITVTIGNRRLSENKAAVQSTSRKAQFNIVYIATYSYRYFC